MKRFLTALLLMSLVPTSRLRADDADDQLKEALRDAQATHRHAWRQGRSDLRLEITREGRDGVAVMEGEIRWLEKMYALRFKISDPEGIRYADYQTGTEWNFVARGIDHTLTYFHRGRNFGERPDGPSNLEPAYERSPWVNFAHCCAPNAGPDTTTWELGIGPAPDLLGRLKDSKFVRTTLPNGDVEQHRSDTDGYKSTLIFSAVEGYAVRSSRFERPDGVMENQIDFTYQKLPNGVVAPRELRAAHRSGGRPLYRYHTVYSNMQLPGNVTAADFTREALRGRIDRETTRLAPMPRLNPGRPPVNDASLDPLVRSLRRANKSEPR